jgi:Zn-dependent peptidase ImmA (M78 family)
MPTFSQIDRRAEDILRQNELFHVPVDVELVARRLNLRTEAAPLGENVSGLLVVEKGHGVIGYNVTQALVRQRFTIAHEIGHFVLHVSDNPSALFIDTHYIVYRRDAQSSTGEDRHEREANRFAAALLMPATLLQAEIEKPPFDFGDEEMLTELAGKFQVSTQAMSIRLSSLGFNTWQEE